MLESTRRIESTTKWIIIFGIVVGVCVLVIITYLLFVNHESELVFAVSAVAGIIYFLISFGSDFQVSRFSYIGGVAVCSLVILTAVLLYFQSTTFPVRARYKMERYAKSHALEESASTGNKIDIDDSRASYMFFTKDGKPYMLLVRETREEDLGAVKKISILIP